MNKYEKHLAKHGHYSANTKPSRLQRASLTKGELPKAFWVGRSVLFRLDSWIRLRDRMMRLYLDSPTRCASYWTGRVKPSASSPCY